MKNLYILLIFMMLLSCGKSEKNEVGTVEQTENYELVVTKQQFEGEQMQFGTLIEHEFDESVKANGMIDVPTHNKSTVSTFVGGYVTKTPLLIGDEVKKGQFLVSLENTEFVEIQQAYLEVAERLNYLKSEFTRQKTLFDENITSQKNFLNAESAYKSSLAHYNGLRKKLQMMNISPTAVENGNITSVINLYAPIDGYVTKVNVSNGTYVSPSDIIMEIIDTDHIHLELSVFEKDILKVKKAQKINFRIPEASDSIFKAEVHLVGTTIDPVNRRVTVHGHIDDDHTKFVVGMFAEAEIIISNSIRAALLKEAVVKIDNEYFVLIIDSEKANEYHFNKVKLNVGLQTEDYVEVLNPNAIKGKKILSKGTYMLLNEGED